MLFRTIAHFFVLILTQKWQSNDPGDGHSDGAGAETSGRGFEVEDEKVENERRRQLARVLQSGSHVRRGMQRIVVP